MDDIVPGPAHLLSQLCELLSQALGVAEVELGEMCARVGEVLAAAGGAHAGPHFVASVEAFADDEAAYEA